MQTIQTMPTQFTMYYQCRLAANVRQQSHYGRNGYDGDSDVTFSRSHYEYLIVTVSLPYSCVTMTAIPTAAAMIRRCFIE